MDDYQTCTSLAKHKINDIYMCKTHHTRFINGDIFKIATNKDIRYMREKQTICYKDTINIVNKNINQSTKKQSINDEHTVPFVDKNNMSHTPINEVNICHTDIAYDNAHKLINQLQSNELSPGEIELFDGLGDIGDLRIFSRTQIFLFNKI